MPSNDPQAIVDNQPMSRFQWGVVAIMIGLNALDGFDVLSISFASPGIAKDWGIDRAALGIVLSMELIGMAIGSLLLGGLADRIGRRNTILLCLVVMAAGMFGASASHDVYQLSGWRVLTGLGVGGMLAATNAAVAEVSNLARRNLAVVLMAAGYPVGAIIGGSISQRLLVQYDWRAVFVFGAVATLAFIPLVLWRSPESISFLLTRRPANALERINATLARMGHAAVDALPPVAVKAAKVPIARLFSGANLAPTVLLTIAYLAHIMTFYFILKWVPKIVVDMGFEPAAAAGVLIAANVGGVTGSVLLGLLTAKVRLMALTVAAMLASVVMITLFGRGQATLDELTTIAAIAGFFTNAGVVGLYALVARSFGTEVRASATGFVIGIGRGGSAAAPAIAGFLFAAGYGLPVVAMLMAGGSLVAAIALVVLARVQKAAA
ncbi:MFS transporter [Sphingomonas sp. G-3-2-10]|jgi:benzoate transport|uniref:MFS transporter n=1 Tax=Sphingomonas sp. G-3-2-10 TaxID=2728838 RepID=UPI00146E6C75|nr:MFS transporter [Sphingomonas sp. G-3-2-10]NML04360.1 MFS transporter [Sphingomonas sp. G-3-2-10]